MPHAGTNNTRRAKLKSPTWSRAPRPAAWTPPDAPVRLGPRAGVCGPRGHAGRAGPSSPVLPDADEASRETPRPGSPAQEAGPRSEAAPGPPRGAAPPGSRGCQPEPPSSRHLGRRLPGSREVAVTARPDQAAHTLPAGAPVLPGGGRQAGRQAGCFHHVFFFLFGPVGIVYLIHRFSSVRLEDS